MISTALRFFQQSRLIYRRLQAVVLTIFLILVKWSKYTHRISSDKSLFLHKAPSVKSTPPLFHHKDATGKYPFSNYSGNIYLELWVALFQLSVNRFSEMQFGVKYLETWGGTQPYFAFLTLAFVLISWFLADHTRPRILLHCMSQCLLCLEFSFFIWFMDGACLLCLAVNIAHSLTQHLSKSGLAVCCSIYDICSHVTLFPY